MKLKSLQKPKAALATSTWSSRAGAKRVRGFAGNHTKIEAQTAGEKPDLQRDLPEPVLTSAPEQGRGVVEGVPGNEAEKQAAAQSEGADAQEQEAEAAAGASLMRIASG